MWTVLSSSNFQWVLMSTLMLGIAAGVMGCLAYWKRQSLMSDALAHAALPGVIIAFVLLGEKHPLILIIGASISAYLGALFIQWIQTSTRIKEDTAMGMILSVFFGLGIMLLTVVNRSPSGNQSGLDRFILGQAASMVKSDVFIMLLLSLFIIFFVFIAFKEWKIFLFDPGFAKGLGLSLRGMEGLYTALLVLTIVVGIQAVGVVLMAALIIIPATSARYWTHSFKVMVGLSALFGGGSGALGTFVSALGSGWPTGPFIVIVAAFIFTISLVFGKEKGVLIQWLQQKMLKMQYQKERMSRTCMSRPLKEVSR